MEFRLPSFPILSTFFLFIFMVLKIFKKYSQNSNPPPGPFKFPLIGNLPQLMGGLPHHRLKALATQYGPVMSIQMGQLSSVVISSAETAKEVLKIQDTVFADRALLLAARTVLYAPLDIMYGPFGDHWKQLRKISTLELLSAKRVQSFRSIREEEISNFINLLRSTAGLSVNLSTTLYGLTNSLMAITSIGKKCNNQEIILDMINKLVDVTGDFGIVDVFPSLEFLHYLSGVKYKLRKLHEETDRIFEDMISEQRATRSSRSHQGEADNLLDVLLNLQENGNLQIPLTNDSIKAVIVEMFAGGTDTSAKTTEWAMAELMKNPMEMKKAQQEVRQVFGEMGKVDESRFSDLKYLKMVVKETLRLHPALALIPRMCREKTRVNGYDIYPETKIFVNAYAIHRDPNLWTGSQKFWPARFETNSIDLKGTNFELIPFGAGKRICPGMIVGLTNVELFLANLLFHFDWKLPDGLNPETLDMTEAFGGAMHRKEQLIMIPIPVSV